MKTKKTPANNQKVTYEYPPSLPCVGKYDSHIFVSEEDPNLKIDLGGFCSRPVGTFGSQFNGEASDEVADSLDGILFALMHCGTNSDPLDEGDLGTLNSAHWMLSFIRDCFRAMRIRNPEPADVIDQAEKGELADLRKFKKENYKANWPS